MPQEAIISDFSGGMNASAGMDKLAENECLLAENVRFDEQGNVLITGANTLQNTATLADGTGNRKVHSLFFDPSIGAVAGVGTAVFLGNDFTSLAVSTSTANVSASKMSFGAAPNRIYMDLNAVGYFKDVSQADLVTVDWAPPSASSAITTGPKTAGTGINSGTLSTWTNPNAITGTSTYAFGTNISGGALSMGNLLCTNFGFALGTAGMQGIQLSVFVAANYFPTGTHTCTLSVNATLLVGGVSVGTSKQYKETSTDGTFDAGTIFLGNAADLWGDAALTPTQVNAANFGIAINASIQGPGTSQAFIGARQVTLTAYQGASGFVAAGAASGGLNGTYTWKLTFSAINGEESDGSSPSSIVVLTAQGGTLTAIPAGDVRTVSRNIYRKGGTLSSYYLVGKIPDNSTTTFFDNQSDLAALTDAIILAGNTVGDEPNTRLGSQAVKYPTYHYDRVFWASGSTLIWSKPLNGFAYPADFSTPVGDGKSITGIFSMGGQLFIMKPDSIWQLTGTDENSFLLSKTLSPVGTDWPFSAVLSGGASSGFYFTGRILFANSRGIWAFNGYTSNKVTPKLDTWFRQNDHTGISVFGTTGFHVPEIMNSPVAQLNSAAANPLFYYLSYAESGQSVPNAMLALDLERGAISKRSFAAQSLVADPVEGYIYGGNASGSVLKLDDWAAANNGLGVAVNVDFQDRYRDLGLRGSRFSLEGLEFLLTTTGETVLVTVYFDEGQSSETLGAISTPTHSTAKVYRKVQSAASRFCRNFSIRLNYQGKLVNSSNIPNIQLIHIKAYFDPRGARARTGEAP